MTASTIYYESQFFTTTLSVVGGIDASQTTGIVLQSVSGIFDTSKPGIALASYADPLSTTTAEWITFTSINSTTKTLVGVTRGEEGFSAKTHANGVTIAFPHSKSHINEIAKLLDGTNTGASLNTPTITSAITKPAVTAVSGATPDLDLNAGNQFTLTLSEAATLTVSNETVGQCFLLQITQDSEASEYAVTWMDTVHWDSGTAPTLSTGASEVDLLGFRVIGTDTYQGLVMGQAMAAV